MKNYKITVNGQRYDVTVEEVGEGVPPASGSRAAAPVLPGAPKPTPAPSSATATSGPPQARSGSIQVRAPMPGTLLGYKVALGQTVKRGDVLLILEAMKMENEIVAPADGSVAALSATEGAAVSTGDLLVELA